MEPLEPHSGRRRIDLIARMRDAAVDIRPLRESRDYRRLYLGTAVSFIGSQITFVAVPFQVFDLTGSSVAVGIIGLCELVPIAGLSLIGGAIADAVDRRRLLLVTETGLALCSVLLAVNSLARPPRIWVIYVLVSISAGLFAIGLPAIRSAAPRLLPQDQLAAAAALASIYGNVGFIAGPLIAGLTIEGAGVQWAYWADAATFIVSIAAVRAAAPIPPLPGAASPGPKAVLEGIKYLRGRKVLQGSFVIDLIAMVFGMPRALFPALAAASGGGPGVVGIFYAAPAAGALAAALSSGWSRRVRRQGVAVYIAVVCWGAALALFGLSRIIWPAVVALIVAGAADMVSGVFRTAILQSSTPAHLQGRLTGIELLVVASGPSLGDFEAGVVAGLTTARVSAVSGGIACIVGVGIMALLLPAFARYEAA